MRHALGHDLEHHSAAGTLDANLYNGAGTGGNNIALQLVMQGMKLQPCPPGFLDARDAILGADDVLYQGQYHSPSGEPLPAVAWATAPCRAPRAAPPTKPGLRRIRRRQLDKISEMSRQYIHREVNATCNCDAPLSNYSLKDVMPTGMQFVSGTGATVAGSTVTFSNVNFTAPLQTRTFTFQARAATGASLPLPAP